jgi:hypothetical protein
VTVHPVAEAVQAVGWEDLEVFEGGVRPIASRQLEQLDAVQLWVTPAKVA